MIQKQNMQLPQISRPHACKGALHDSIYTYLMGLVN